MKVVIFAALINTLISDGIAIRGLNKQDTHECSLLFFKNGLPNEKPITYEAHTLSEASVEPTLVINEYNEDFLSSNAAFILQRFDNEDDSSEPLELFKIYITKPPAIVDSLVYIYYSANSNDSYYEVKDPQMLYISLDAISFEHSTTKLRGLRPNVFTALQVTCTLYDCILSAHYDEIMETTKLSQQALQQNGVAITSCLGFYSDTPKDAILLDTIPPSHSDFPNPENIIYVGDYFERFPMIELLSHTTLQWLCKLSVEHNGDKDIAKLVKEVGKFRKHDVREELSPNKLTLFIGLERLLFTEESLTNHNGNLKINETSKQIINCLCTDHFDCVLFIRLEVYNKIEWENGMENLFKGFVPADECGITVWGTTYYKMDIEQEGRNAGSAIYVGDADELEFVQEQYSIFVENVAKFFEIAQELSSVANKFTEAFDAIAKFRSGPPLQGEGFGFGILNHTSIQYYKTLLSQNEPALSTLFLDIDGTLVHSLSIRPETDNQLCYNMEYDTANQHIVKHVCIRPHVTQFLDEICGTYFECVLFTAGTEEYGNQIKKLFEGLLKRNIFVGVFGRDDMFGGKKDIGFRGRLLPWCFIIEDRVHYSTYQSQTVFAPEYKHGSHNAPKDVAFKTLLPQFKGLSLALRSKQTTETKMYIVDNKIVL